MHQDAHGIAVTSDSAAAIRYLDAATRSLLGHRADFAHHLGASLAADPDLVVAHALLGFAQLLQARAELVDTASRHAEAARHTLDRRGGTLREMVLVDALDLWIGGDMAGCADRLAMLLETAPHDALSFKLGYALRFMLGDVAGMRGLTEAILPAWDKSVLDYGYVLGCYAFALEEAGEFDRAERLGSAALELEPCDVWAYHAVTHVHEMRQRPSDGLAWLADRRARSIGINNFARHLAWHEALFHLARRDLAAVLALYDREIRDERTDDYRDIANAASLLWRLEREGACVGDRWEELADLAERRRSDFTLAFAALHRMICLLGAHRPVAREFASAMARSATAPRSTQERVIMEVAVPLLRIAHSLSGAAKTVRVDVDALVQRLPAIGGSTAQRHIFTLMLADYAVRERISALPSAA
jgi:hypothetical protein